MAKFFLYTFATGGDKTVIPNATQPSGAVSYQEGWGYDYQRDKLTDPLAKQMPRDQTNQLFFDITDNLRQYQSHGVPDFITSADNGGSPFSYDIYARVRYDAGSGFHIYENQLQANTSLPSDPTWIQISGGLIPAGVMFDFGGTSVPAGGFLPCDGSAVSRTTYAALFAAIGTLWGVGDGSTTFNLPGLARRATIGSGGVGTGVLGNAVGNIGGTETRNLSINDIPDHTHNPLAGNFDINVGSGGFENFNAGTQNTNASTTGGVTSHGGQTAVSLYSPSAVVLKIIKF